MKYKLIKKQIAIIPRKKAKIASRIFYPKNFTRRIRKELNIERITPNQIGKLKSIFSAIAEPRTSCMSAPMIAISAIIQSNTD